ncbi:MAG: hypothetical protein WBO23_00355 [Burkholderiales bacterium]
MNPPRTRPRPFPDGKFLRGLARPVLAAAFLSAVAAGPAMAAEDLGRLFLTPQQRQELDRRRNANIRESAVVVENLVTATGQVSRSSGKNTFWLNGVPQANPRKPLDPAKVTVPAGEGEASVTLKIGQTLDKVRGEIRDELGRGKIAVRPAGKR